VHRRLKNSVNGDQYLLLTKAAQRDVDFPDSLAWASGSETYEEIGCIDTLVYLPGQNTLAAVEAKESATTTRITRASKLFCKLWFSPLLPKQRLHHVDSNASSFGRAAFAGLTILLTPFFLPVGLMVAIVRALRPASRARGHDHEHRPDRACCGKRDH